MRLLSLAFTTSLLTGCIATQGFAKRSPRLSPRKEGAALLAIGAAQLLFGAAITYASIYGKSPPSEPSESVTDGLKEGAKEVGGRFFGAIFGGLLALGGAGDFLGGLVQTTTGSFFIDPEAEEKQRLHLDLLRRTPVNTTGNSDLDEPPQPPKQPLETPISITPRSAAASPTSSAPTSSAPTSSAPTSSAPTSSATSSAPTSSAPTSSAPTSAAPTSSATSSAPTATAPNSRAGL